VEQAWQAGGEANPPTKAVITAHAADLKHGVDMPEGDGHRIASECFLAPDDRLEKISS
jgi:hypothetical protein